MKTEKRIYILKTVPFGLRKYSKLRFSKELINEIVIIFVKLALPFSVQLFYTVLTSWSLNALKKKLPHFFKECFTHCMYRK